jgi:5-methylcytosine-specific restriction protein A
VHEGDIFLYESDFSDEDENEMNAPVKKDFPDEGGDNSSEGGRTKTHVTRCARSRAARDRCIEIYKAKCIICKFDFEKTYGEVGKGLIHVHHLNQLSKNTEKHIVNAMEDLRPVCPNCHFIIHKNKNEAYKIDDVEKMIEDNKILLKIKE